MGVSPKAAVNDRRARYLSRPAAAATSSKRTVVDACSLKNIPIVQGGVIFIAVIYGVINLLVDIIYGFIDPRISSIYRRKDVKKRA